ncbi:MAG: FAD-dependent oxidoreductase [Micromonosporaceae bacterium]|nr:FAD-dependent oxidoreductase [Micromonosporaceae bacterium]
MRVVVVGGGVIGLLTAMECVRAGAQVELVDQAGIPSRLATSHDRHRVVRALHRGDPVLTRAAVRAHAGWLEVERRLGTRFYHQVGALTAMPDERVPAELELLRRAGAAAQELPAGELAARFPRVRFPAGRSAVFEPAAGAVLADRMLAALAGWLRGVPGVRLHPGRRATRVGPAGGVRLDGGSELSGDRVVVAAGPWSRELLPAALGADLTLYRQTMLSYSPIPSRDAWAGTPAIPAFGTPHGAWLMPPVADTPVRLSAASACREVPELTDRVPPDHWRNQLVDQFRELLVDFDPAAVLGASDGYYLADRAGGGPVLARLGDGAVWAYAACGGMSFKFAPLVARALADRALGRPPHRTGLAPVDQPRELAPTVRPSGGAR